MGIEADREEIRRATRWNPAHGGDPVDGLQYLATKYGLKYESYPLGDALIWQPYGEKGGRKATPEDNKERLFAAYLERLEAGWVAATQIRWAEGQLDHAVALIGASNSKIKVACSMRGIYEVGSELFQGPTGKLQAGTFTGWAKLA